MTGKRLRLGIVGTGENARDHANASREIDVFDLVCICDTSLVALETFGEVFGCENRYTDLAQMLQEQALDVLVVSVWGVHHAAVAMEAMVSARVRAIVVEKPISMDAAEAQLMVDTAERTGVLLIEAFKWRYDPQHSACGEVIASGRIGEVKTVMGVFSSPLTDRLDVSNWRYRADLGGGSLFDSASYLVHFSRFVMGREPTSVVGTRGDGADVRRGASELSASLLLDFGGGRTALLQSSYAQAFCQEVMVIGTAGWLRYMLPFDSRGSRDGELMTGTPLAATVDLFLNDFTHEVLTFPPCNQFVAQLLHVQNCLAGTALPVTSGAFAVGSMLVLDAARESFATRRIVEL
ncbi:MAG: Gfo/Idh/MocA family oxidoreductase [Candidatus Nanopelagicales bacterium]|nr:Gfo/Idh/MocA family oxidoreductase [Candidatus Nanopelagicales bacterium]